ncbi:MAG: ribose import ATP-binding protein RbsA [Chloroflexota bacterium]|jgi:ribose transport system ATP-binding protein|nr:MAG: ribose import ATP-binding protein RbsA [Chloroflexota bacterium]
MAALLEAHNITKRFPGTLALDEAQFELQRGEIHALIGENGAGKSTLMKILSGVYVADGGEIRFEGRPVAPANPREALEMGIAIVHQELSVVRPLTVAENIYPGRLPTNRWGMVRYGDLFEAAARVLEQLQVEINPRAAMETLSIANQQLVEIGKALSLNCKVLILDEPTSALTEREAEILFGLLRRLAADGTGIIYISHKLSEIFALADRVTVLRDGRYIGTRIIAETTPDEVVRMMVGRELGDFYPAKSTERGQPLLEVRSLRLPGQSASSSFKLYAGEVLGFAGLIGSGRTELARAIFGADPKAEGEILMEGRPVQITSPAQAIKLGLGYLPEDRKAAGLFLDMAVKLNVEASNLPEVTRSGFISPARERVLAERYVKQLNISTPSIEQEVRRLSGGNQQKTLVAKWLSIQPKILIVDEPTRGIDVGAKREIHYLLRSLAKNNVGVIMISSELPEILGMSDRILVMHEGTIVAELDGATTEEQIMMYASGQQGG